MKVVTRLREYAKRYTKDGEDRPSMAGL